jgi:hypothetical protein
MSAFAVTQAGSTRWADLLTVRDTGTVETFLQSRGDVRDVADKIRQNRIIKLEGLVRPVVHGSCMQHQVIWCASLDLAECSAGDLTSLTTLVCSRDGTVSSSMCLI